MRNGRYNHIEDVLARLHNEQWFGWSDPENRIYANLILQPKIWDSDVNGFIDNPHSKPTEKSLTDALAQQQNEFDAQAYARNRANSYPLIDDVVVALAEKTEGNSQMWDTITAQRLDVKSRFPKP